MSKSRLAIKKPEDMIWVVFLVVIANFLLSTIFVYPTFNMGKAPPEKLITSIIIINFFIYYVLFLAFISYYFKKVGGIISANKTKFYK